MLSKLQWFYLVTIESDSSFLHNLDDGNGKKRDIFVNYTIIECAIIV